MKNKTKAVLGFDTSNYTTSVALMDLGGTLLAEKRQLLSVPEGKRGLRQSDALFQHVKVLPELMEAIQPALKKTDLKAIGASVTPRPVKGSYMPVFLAGESLARSMAAREGVPFYPFSHQEGHVAAGLWSIGRDQQDPFYALHLSGGTTELLKVIPTPKGGYEIDLTGFTKDISMGQLVDRIGVSLGCAFPAGPALEKLAMAWEGELLKIPGGAKQLDLNLSGPETFLQKKIEESADPSQIARSLFYFLGITLGEWLSNHHEKESIPFLLVVGGVASNSIIREHINQTIHNKMEIAYAQRPHCSDHAYGICALSLQQLMNR